MSFNLITENRLTRPFYFSLSFNVANGPPTDIFCYINATRMYLGEEDINREVINALTLTSKVTLRFSIAEAGTYMYFCTINNSRSDAGTINGMTATGSSPTVATVRGIMNYYVTHTLIPSPLPPFSI